METVLEYYISAFKKCDQKLHHFVDGRKCKLLRLGKNVLAKSKCKHNYTGLANAGAVLDVGGGAAVGVIVAILVLITYLIMNQCMKEEDLEF